MSITSQERVALPFVVVFERFHAVRLLSPIFKTNNNPFTFSQMEPRVHIGLPESARESRPLTVRRVWRGCGCSTNEHLAGLGADCHSALSHSPTSYCHDLCCILAPEGFLLERGHRKQRVAEYQPVRPVAFVLVEVHALVEVFG